MYIITFHGSSKLEGTIHLYASELSQHTIFYSGMHFSKIMKCKTLELVFFWAYNFYLRIDWCHMKFGIESYLYNLSVYRLIPYEDLELNLTYYNLSVYLWFFKKIILICFACITQHHIGDNWHEESRFFMFCYSNIWMQIIIIWGGWLCNWKH